ncbi:MAG TPA: hypothetical protein VF145_05330 [Chitinophagaceae bacterium]
MTKRPILLLFFFLALLPFKPASAQDDAGEYYSKARTFMNHGNIDSASFYLDKALAISPDNLVMLEDKAYLQILARDFASAVRLAKALTARPDAGVKTFQILGIAYKEIADYKEAKKMYEQALLKFPNSGLLYSELGDMYSQMNKPNDAIRSWEKGIEMDPGYAGNYFFATLYYAEHGSSIWALLYGENFVNIESLSDRTNKIKGLLADLYKHIATPGFLNSRNNPFAFAVAGTFGKQAGLPQGPVTVEALTSLRIGFIRDWYQLHAARYPFKLFEYQEQLIREGHFDAYNQWLFGESLNADAWRSWSEANAEKLRAFRNFAGGRVFKIPTGQYYQTR